MAGARPRLVAQPSLLFRNLALDRGVHHLGERALHADRHIVLVECATLEHAQAAPAGADPARSPRSHAGPRTKALAHRPRCTSYEVPSAQLARRKKAAERGSAASFLVRPRGKIVSDRWDRCSRRDEVSGGHPGRWRSRWIRNLKRRCLCRLCCRSIRCRPQSQRLQCPHLFRRPCRLRRSRPCRILRRHHPIRLRRPPVRGRNRSTRRPATRTWPL